MSIATRLEAINQHLLDDYSVLTLAGADLTNVDKNIVNLNPTWKERLLYFINNGTDEVYDNWEKVTGEGTEISLNNTLEAKMKVDLKGNTSQYTTTGKNKLGYTLAKLKTYNTAGTWNNNVYSYNNLTFTVNDDMSVTVNGNANANTAFNLMGGANVFTDLNIENGGYNLSGSTGGSNDMSTWCVYLGIKHNDNTTTTIFSYNGDIGFNKTSGDTFFPLIRIGSGAVLNNVKFYPMIRVSTATSEYEEPTQGTISPNPDYPQPIQVVSGDNSIKIEGKNLVFSQLEGKNINNTGQIINATGFNLNIARVVLGQTYTTSKITETSNWDLVCAFYESEPSLGSQSYNSSRVVQNQNSTFTAPITGYVAFRSDSDISNIQLNKGQTSLPYEPYTGASYPINLPVGMELCKIGDYQDKIDKSTGKNLFNPNVEINTTFTSSIATALSNFKSTGQYAKGYISSQDTIQDVNEFITAFINCESGVTYTINNTYSAAANLTSVIFLDNNGNIISRSTTWINNAYTHTTTSEEKYIMVGIKINDNGVDYRNWVMLNEGTTALPYEPYGTSWYLKKEIGKVDLSDYTYNTSAAFTGYQRKTTTGIPNMKYASVNTELGAGLAEKYKNHTGSGMSGEGAKNCFAIDTAMFQVTLEAYTNPSGLLYYALATPTYTLIEDTTLLSQLEAIKTSYEGQTNISQTNNDLPFNLDVSALKGMS